MRFLSVCSGIEAASTAWAPLGWKAVAFSEIEPFPCAVWIGERIAAVDAIAHERQIYGRAAA